MQKDGSGLSPENELKEKPKLKKGVSKVNTSKEEKSKKKRPAKQFITDFS